MRGEAQESAKTYVAIAEKRLTTRNPVDSPAILLTGGETTMTVWRDGTGGLNEEFTLNGILELDAVGIAVTSVDIDDIDGATDAGVIVDASTFSNASTDSQALDSNDSHTLLASINTLI